MKKSINIQGGDVQYRSDSQGKELMEMPLAEGNIVSNQVAKRQKRKDLILGNLPGRGYLILSFTIFIGGFFMVLTDFPQGKAIGWTMTGLSALSMVVVLIYAFIVKRLSTVIESVDDLAISFDQLTTSIATKGSILMLARAVTKASNLFEHAYVITTKDLLQSAQKYGLGMVYGGRSEAEAEIYEKMKEAKREVMCLGVCTGIPVEQPGFSEKTREKIEEHNVSYKFLILKPGKINGTCDFYKQRAKDENNSNKVTSVIGDAKRTVETLEEIYNDLSAQDQHKLGYKAYEAFPYLSMIIIDDVMFVGPYLFGQKCPNTPMFRIEKTTSGQSIFHTYKKHFDDLWISAKNIAPGDFDAN